MVPGIWQYTLQGQEKVKEEGREKGKDREAELVFGFKLDYFHCERIMLQGQITATC